MANANKYYQPTEYEELLLAAGWVTMADLDPDYADYLKSAPCFEEYATYDQWVHMKQEWDAMDTEYEVWITPFYTGIFHSERMPDELVKLQNSLLRDMNHIEYALGY